MAAWPQWRQSTRIHAAIARKGGSVGATILSGRVPTSGDGGVILALQGLIDGVVENLCWGGIAFVLQVAGYNVAIHDSRCRIALW